MLFFIILGVIFLAIVIYALVKSGSLSGYGSNSSLSSSFDWSNFDSDSSSSSDSGFGGGDSSGGGSSDSF